MAYVEMIRVRFLTMLAYRLNYFSGILTYIVYIGGHYFLWLSIYSGKDSIGGMTAAQMTTYVAVAWMTRSFYFTNIDREIAEEIQTGLVAIQLIRPYSYLLGKLTSALGEGAFRLIFWMLPGMVVAALLFPLQLPRELATYGLWALSGALAFLVNALVTALFGLASFFLLRANGLAWARRLVVDLLGGLLLPIHLFPHWLQVFVKWLPFQAIAYLPNMIFTGALSGRQAGLALLTQFAWVPVLAVACLLMWRWARRSIVVQGG